MEEISLREIIETVWKGKWLVALITIAALILTGIGTYIMLPGSQSVVAIVELNYPGVEKGENPDGSNFDIRQLKSPYVIENALKETELDKTGIKSDEVRRNIDIKPIIPNDITQRAENMIKQGNDYVYYPSEFKVIYKVNKAFSYNQGIYLIETVIDEYQKYFYSLYSDIKVIESTIGTLDYSIYDYPDIVEIINAQIDDIQELLFGKTEEGITFRSAQTGQTFPDLNRSFDILRTVDTSKLESLVNTNNLTRDRLSLIKDYEYKVKRMELEQVKKQSEAEEARKLMEEFKKEDYVLLADKTGSQLTTENPQSYYNTLAEKAITASVEATALKHEIAYYQREIERLFSTADASSAQMMAEADKQIESIKIKLLSMIDQTNQTIEDFYAFRYGKSIRQIAPAEMVTSINILMNLAIGLVIGLMIGVFVVFIRYYWKSTAANKMIETTETKEDIPQ